MTWWLGVLTAGMRQLKARWWQGDSPWEGSAQGRAAPGGRRERQGWWPLAFAALSG